jgi:RNA polymerase sigma-70 factor (ECF subfamily)
MGNLYGKQDGIMIPGTGILYKVQILAPRVLYIDKEGMTVDIRSWYETYGPMVIRRCRAILRDEEEALDAAQDVFVNLLRSGSRLHGRFPSSLLYTIATNTCLNRLRHRNILFIKRLFEIPVIDHGFDRVEGELLMDLVFQDETDMNRAICFMYHADGMSLKEIGKTVGLSVSGVRKRLGAFRERARLKLGGNI